MGFWKPLRKEDVIRIHVFEDQFHWYKIIIIIKSFTITAWIVELSSSHLNGFQLSNFLFLKMSLQTATYTYNAIWHLLVWWTAPKKALILTFIFCIFLAVMILISSWANIQSRRAICHESYVSGLCKIFLGSGSPGWYGLFKKNDFLFMNVCYGF